MPYAIPNKLCNTCSYWTLDICTKIHVFILSKAETIVKWLCCKENATCSEYYLMLEPKVLKAIAIYISLHHISFVLLSQRNAKTSAKNRDTIIDADFRNWFSHISNFFVRQFFFTFENGHEDYQVWWISRDHHFGGIWMLIVRYNQNWWWLLLWSIEISWKWCMFHVHCADQFYRVRSNCINHLFPFCRLIRLYHSDDRCW